VPETPPRATLGWSYSGLRLLLVIAASPESSMKNLKIVLLVLLNKGGAFGFLWMRPSTNRSALEQSDLSPPFFQPAAIFTHPGYF
jgi:hypothetical protein